MRKLLTGRELAAQLGISRRTLERLRRTGSGPPFVKFGNGASAPIRYAPDDVTAWLGAQRRRCTQDRSAA